MEFVEYMPGALAAGWMVVKMVMLLRNGPAAAEADSATCD
jgi:hypothetical protein